tara:strand:- start:3012 stop:4901 length:1890 start_codon:yes stop_codon:yes gene_type:complete
MAINLNPGADATLVNTAYKAAVSDAPGSYSGTLEKAADSYEKTMEAQSKTFGSIATLGASIGAEMIESANELDAMIAVGAGLDPEGSAKLMEDLYANKDAQKKLRGINFLQSRETRQDKQKLKLEQKRLFGEIDELSKTIELGSGAVAAGTFKMLPGNEVDAEMVNAIIKSNLKDKVTKEGNIARLTRSEKTGELMYTMYRADGTPSDLGNGEPVTMTIKQFSKAIATNVDDKGVMKGRFDSIVDSSAKSGNTSLKGVYDPEMKQMHLNQLDEILKTDTDLQRAFGEKFGYSNSSFIEDMQKPSNLSTWVYNDLLAATGGVDGELALGGVTEGIEDTDDSGGISQAELQNATNYGILASNILGMKDPEVSKALFKEYTIDKFEAAHKYGYSKKPPVAGKNVKTATGKDKLGFYSKGNKVQLLNNQYLSGGSAQSLYNDIEGGNSFDAKDPLTGNINNYSYKVVGGEGGWYENYEEGDTPGSNQYIGSGHDLSKKFTNDVRYKNIQTTVEQEVDLKTGLTNFDNPFGDGTDKIAAPPSDFVKAVGNDDLKVKEYLDSMKIKGLEVKASGFGSDSITLKLGGKSKTFIVDPNFTGDEDRASEIWKWLHANWSEGGSSYSGSAADIVAGVES